MRHFVHSGLDQLWSRQYILLPIVDYHVRRYYHCGAVSQIFIHEIGKLYSYISILSSSPFSLSLFLIFSPNSLFCFYGFMLSMKCDFIIHYYHVTSAHAQKGHRSHWKCWKCWTMGCYSVSIRIWLKLVELFGAKTILIVVFRNYLSKLESWIYSLCLYIQHTLSECPSV